MKMNPSEEKCNRKSNALKKFQSLHPAQHQLFSSIWCESAQKQGRSCFVLPTESEEINSEYTNMIKNKTLFQFRAEDEICGRPKLHKALVKTVSWDNNLLSIRTISPRTVKKFPSGNESNTENFAQIIQHEATYSKVLEINTRQESVKSQSLTEQKLPK